MIESARVVMHAKMHCACQLEVRTNRASPAPQKSSSGQFRVVAVAREREP